MAAECASRAIQMKTHFHIEHRLKHRDGSWRWVLCVGNPRFDAQGRLLGHSGAVTDVHERRTWERRGALPLGAA
jgi:PAS domain S-box-containing protein